MNLWVVIWRKGDNKLLYSFRVDDKGKAQLPSMKDDVEYEKPFKINPKDTLVMMRGLMQEMVVHLGIYGRTLEHEGYTLVNSVLCNDICNDKWYKQIIFQQK